ncbi:hypothetical protein, conserved [Plasmodium gonderi]|uniref:Uncharacterized protein n=1 Tax=Plasmodium gonderi TaxID=77519 RepID=A0A1Y1JH05_PLAGO|nr:hypothetical protein, conserved [Plasmodium gonderi]GAW80497.1 hypothetical protein, conserved [Plasmodium gonderi]
MNFVKTHIYKQEYTNEGIKELEKDARSTKEIDQNKILKELPEFKRNNQFLSLSEQLELNKNNSTNNVVYGKDDNDGEGHMNIYAMPNLTEEYAEYYESYAKNDNYSAEKIRQREYEVELEFKEAIKSFVKKKELNEKKNNSDLFREETNVNLKEIKKNIIKNKKKNEVKSNVKAIIKTKKKTSIACPENHVDIKKHTPQEENNSLLIGYSDYSDG